MYNIHIMKKSRKNPVAKFGRRFNKGGAHRDKTKYNRNDYTDNEWCEFCDEPFETGSHYKCWIK